MNFKQRTFITRGGSYELHFSAKTFIKCLDTILSQTDMIKSFHFSAEKANLTECSYWPLCCQADPPAGVPRVRGAAQEGDDRGG